MTTTERHARNDRIVQLRARGQTLKSIAQEVGLTERQCRRVLKERLGPAAPAPAQAEFGRARSEEPTATWLDGLERSLQDLAAIANQYCEPHNVVGLFTIEMALSRGEECVEKLRAAATICSGSDRGTPLDDRTFPDTMSPPGPRQVRGASHTGSD